MRPISSHLSWTVSRLDFLSLSDSFIDVIFLYKIFKAKKIAPTIYCKLDEKYIFINCKR